MHCLELAIVDPACGSGTLPTRGGAAARGPRRSSSGPEAHPRRSDYQRALRDVVRRMHLWRGREPAGGGDSARSSLWMESVDPGAAVNVSWRATSAVVTHCIGDEPCADGRQVCRTWHGRSYRRRRQETHQTRSSGATEWRSTGQTDSYRSKCRERDGWGTRSDACGGGGSGYRCHRRVGGESSGRWDALLALRGLTSGRSWWPTRGVPPSFGRRRPNMVRSSRRRTYDGRCGLRSATGRYATVARSSHG